MSMVSMKMDAEEAKEYNAVDSGTEREYPWGLEISLDDEGLAKLGMTTPPDVGIEMMITAKVVVTSASQYQRQGNDAEISSCWQITDMEVSAAPGNKDHAAALYSNG